MVDDYRKLLPCTVADVIAQPDDVRGLYRVDGTHIDHTLPSIKAEAAKGYIPLDATVRDGACAARPQNERDKIVEQLPLRVQEFVDELTGYAGFDAVRLPTGNRSHPYMLKTLLELVDEWWIGWLIEDEADSPYEANLRCRPDLTAADGLLIGTLVPCVFGNYFEFQSSTDNEGRDWFRLIGDAPQPDPLE